MKPPSHPLPTPSQPSSCSLAGASVFIPSTFVFSDALTSGPCWSWRDCPPRVGWFLDTASSSPVGLSHANLSSISSLLHCPDLEPVWATTHPAPLMLGPGTRWLRKPLPLHSPLTFFILAIQRLLSLPRLPFPEKWPSGSWPCFHLSRSASWKTLGVPMWPGHRMTGCVSCF